VLNVQAVNPALASYKVGHELNHALLCNSPGEVQAVHVVLSPVQVDHPPCHDNQVPVIFTRPVEQSETHVVPSINKVPIQDKHVVTDPEQVAHGEVQISQDVEVDELMNPVGQLLKH
jgi:dTDP-4-dehydrorhamnose 3,5-epimerase-like enzyme